MSDPCTCNNPCCYADVGVGVIDCGSQHCPQHGIYVGQEPTCFRCGKSAEEFDYTGYKDDNQTNSDFVRTEDGTYNKDTNRFACDQCYIEIGMPTHPYGWKAP
jgi:hypothetical protein